MAQSVTYKHDIRDIFLATVACISAYSIGNRHNLVFHLIDFLLMKVTGHHWFPQSGPGKHASIYTIR